MLCNLAGIMNGSTNFISILKKLSTTVGLEKAEETSATLPKIAVSKKKDCAHVQYSVK